MLSAVKAMKTPEAAKRCPRCRAPAVPEVDSVAPDEYACALRCGWRGYDAPPDPRLSLGSLRDEYPSDLRRLTLIVEARAAEDVGSRLMPRAVTIWAELVRYKGRRRWHVHEVSPVGWSLCRQGWNSSGVSMRNLSSAVREAMGGGLYVAGLREAVQAGIEASEAAP